MKESNETPEEIRALKDSLNSRGVNLLLNSGCDHLGRLPAEAIRILDELKRLQETSF